MSTRVSCHLKDCVQWRESKVKEPKISNACDCQHPDKEMYLDNKTCPLYKKDWASNQTASLAERFKKKRLQ